MVLWRLSGDVPWQISCKSRRAEFRFVWTSVALIVDFKSLDVLLDVILSFPAKIMVVSHV